MAVVQTERYFFFFYRSQENRDKLTERTKKQTTTSIPSIGDIISYENANVV